ncbi:MAG TPA: hypothetical protein VG537_08260 [Candidatus Kapabacteria bacterium]|nr:hypothetical protein [Candidatus Kapabacteria bacterium]
MSHLWIKLTWVLLLVATAVTCLFFLVNFPIVGHDSYFHLTNLDQFIKLRNEGITLPRWTPNNFRGLGSATLYFYPPLLSVLGAIFHLAGASVEYSLNMVALFATGTAILFCRWYLSLLGFRSRNAWMGALLYAIGPYAFFDVMIRSALSEYLAFAWVPLVFIGLEYSFMADRPASRKSVKALIISCLGWSLLVLTNISALILILWCIAILLVVRMNVRSLWKLVPFGLGSVLAILCTSFYIFPVLHFQSAAQLFQLSQMNGAPLFAQNIFAHLFSIHEGSSAFISAFMLPIAIILAVVWYRRWRQTSARVHLGWSLIMLLVVLVQIPYLAAPVAKVFPPLALIQFPFRFFLIVCLSISIWSSTISKEQIPKYGLFYIGISSVAVLLLAVFIIAREPYGVRYPIEEKIGWSLPAYAPVQASWNPDTVNRLANENMNDSEVTAVSGMRDFDTLQTIYRKGSRSEFYVNLHQPTLVQFHRFYWPLWNLQDDRGMQIPLQADSNGLLRAVLPAGNYHLMLEIIKSPIEDLGEKISIMGVCFIGFLCVLCFYLSRKPIAIEP